MPLLILPFGLIPVYLLIAFVLWKFAEGGWERLVTSKIREGITEYPSMVSLLLHGSNQDRMEFNHDGTKIIYTVASGAPFFTDSVTFHEYLKDIASRRSEEVDFDLFDIHVVQSITQDEKTGLYEVIINVPESMIQSDKYIEQEIKNFGRVFTRNSSNSERWLIYPQKEQKVYKKDGRTFIDIHRTQLVPGLFDSKQKVMSERQITRNIKNRLWNKFDVKCISIDQSTYHGEILLK